MDNELYKQTYVDNERDGIYKWKQLSIFLTLLFL